MRMPDWNPVFQMMLSCRIVGGNLRPGDPEFITNIAEIVCCQILENRALPCG